MDARLQFTTIDSLSRRLAGRLELSGVQGVAPPWGNKMGGKSADTETVTQVAEQKETFVRNILRMVYRFPLQLKEPDTVRTLAEITEKLTIADVLDLYFQGSAMQAGAEVSGLAAADRKAAYELLHLYTASSNIPIPQLDYSPPSSGTPTRQGVLLPGESLNPDTPDHLTRNYTVVGHLARPGRIEFGSEHTDSNRPRDALQPSDFNRFARGFP
jgi:hypothetical protein